jgi:hypothetical protein
LAEPSTAAEAALAAVTDPVAHARTEEMLRKLGLVSDTED